MSALGELLVRLGIDRTGFDAGLKESEAQLATMGTTVDKVGVQTAGLSATELKQQEATALADLAQTRYTSTLARYGDGAAQTELAEARLGKARLASADAAKAEAVETGGLSGMLSQYLTPANLAVAAGTALIAVMGESVKAAAEDSQSIALLNTSLKSNVPGWDGNVTAIEDYIASAEQASAFSKDELRTSLETLVGATHDVAKAERDQTIATNLARYTQEDLGTATQTVIDIEAGRFRGLAALGIQVTKNMTVQQALNAVNSVAAGQDTSYLGTAAGGMAELNNKIHDLEVELGTKLLPVFKDLLNFINANLIPAVGFLADMWDKVLNTITAGASRGFAQWNAYQQAQEDAATAAAVSAQVAAAATKNWVDQTTSDLADLGQAGQAYWNKAKAIQLAGQEAAAAASAPYYADALQRQKASADERLSAQDQASLVANNHAIVALNAETKAEATIMNAANKASYALQMRAGFDAAAALAQGFQQGRANIKTGWQNLIDEMRHVPSTPAQIAQDEGELGSKTLAKALGDHRPEVRAAAIAQVQTLMDQLTLLGVKAPKLSAPAAAALKKAMADTKNPTLKAAEAVQNAVSGALDQPAEYYTYGYKTGTAYTSGMKDGMAGLPNAVVLATTAAKHKLKADSPPGPESPLHEIDKWGLRTGQAYVAGLTDGLKPTGLQAALSGIAGGFGGMTPAMGSITSGINHAAIPPIQLVVDGRTLAEVNDRQTPALVGIYGSPVAHNSSRR